MPTLSQHPSASIVKLLALGDSKVGKTSSLVSLVAAGYKLYILDFDNLLDVLRQRILETCPDKIDNVEYRSLRDKYKPSATGGIIDGRPKAWIESLKMLNEWKYTDEATGETIDRGIPSTWGPNCVLVIDSLTRWCDSAINLHDTIMPKTKSGKDYDGRAVYFNAQTDVEKQLATLTSDGFNTNVIVICHGRYLDMPDGTVKVFPDSTGKALSPNIPTYFPNYIQYIRKGVDRLIKLESDPMINLALASPKLTGYLPAATGLAEIFAVLRGQPTKSTPARSPTLLKAQA